MPNLIEMPMELWGRVGVTTLVSVFADPSRAPYVVLLSRRDDYEEHAANLCRAMGYDAHRTDAVINVLRREGRVSLVHEDGSLYCTLHLHSMQVVR